MLVAEVKPSYIENVLGTYRPPRKGDFYIDSHSDYFKNLLYITLRNVIIEHMKVSRNRISFIDLQPSDRKYFRDAVQYMAYPSIESANTGDNSFTLAILYEGKVIDENRNIRHDYKVVYGFIDAKAANFKTCMIFHAITLCKINNIDELINNIDHDYIPDKSDYDTRFGYIYLPHPQQQYGIISRRLETCPYKFIHMLGYFLKKLNEEIMLLP